MNRESSQLAIWLMEEHDSGNCADTCLFKDGLTKSIEREADLVQWLNSGLPHVEDLVKAEVLGFICGGTEIPDRFWTTDHQYVAIDNERMFECEPNLSACPWMDWSTGRNLAKELLESLASIPDEELCRMAELPSGYAVSPTLCLKMRLLWIKELAVMEHFESDAVIEKTFFSHV